MSQKETGGNKRAEWTPARSQLGNNETAGSPGGCGDWWPQTSQPHHHFYIYTSLKHTIAFSLPNIYDLIFRDNSNVGLCV